MFGCSYVADVVWVVWAAAAATRGDDAALGFLTSSGIAFMITWYSLRTYDRHAFTALVHAEWGLWSSSAFLGVVSRIVDALVHVVLPCVMLCWHFSRVKLWMSPVAMLVAVGMHRLRHRCPSLPFHRFVFYQFTPRRSRHFWDAALTMDVLIHGSLPLFCHVALEHPMLLYVNTLLLGTVVIGLHMLRSMLLPKVRGAAADIMRRLLAQGNIHPASAMLPRVTATDEQVHTPPLHMVVHDEHLWLDWMSDGLVAIGESYVSGQWSLGPDVVDISIHVDTVVHRLLTLPVEARRDMYQSWPARWVSLATRVCQYPSSAACHVVDPVQHDPLDDDDSVCRVFGTYQGRGLWQDGDTLNMAQDRALHAMALKLSLVPYIHGYPKTILSIEAIAAVVFLNMNIDSWPSGARLELGVWWRRRLLFGHAVPRTSDFNRTISTRTDCSHPIGPAGQHRVACPVYSACRYATSGAHVRPIAEWF
ncbi:hypothetical protein, variant 2 [Aphanomyces astaci]|uniref:Uncharacterized protein n=1 Tax=Aphanomyces astaci TaxID=112090 RepID=W4F9C4_APHAT|nr:hypothetical protein, variant 2 [Aphanomyces astaci]ETV64070.1 hypothetical protein, variant 2 [Aphanomyces astaci]|eukprot:XP_009846447.1 hypothetical protein, variant 2 [Aphanomyces astaci]